MKCPKCHLDNAEGAKFCSECGEKMTLPATKVSESSARGETIPPLVSKVESMNEKNEFDLNAVLNELITIERNDWDTFWSQMIELSESVPEQFIVLSTAMLDKNMIENYTEALRLLRGWAYYRKASIAFDKTGDQFSNEPFSLLEQALFDLKDADSLIPKLPPLQKMNSQFENRIDAAAKVLEGIIPGISSDILGKLKLKYLRSDRISNPNEIDNLAIDDLISSFGNFFLKCETKVSSVAFVSNTYENAGKRYVDVQLFGENTDTNEELRQFASVNIISICEDGTYSSKSKSIGRTHEKITVNNKQTQNDRDQTTQRVDSAQSKSPSARGETNTAQTQTLPREPLREKGSANKSDIKADLKKAAGDTFANVLSKSKALKSAIDSGEYKKALENESVKKVLSWFRVSDERLRTPIYIIWTYTVFGILFFMDSRSSMMTLINPGFILSGLMMYGFGYVMRSSEKFRNWLNKPREIKFEGTIEGAFSAMWAMFFFIPRMCWWMYCWPAEKLYYFFFDKYTCLNMGLGYLEREDYAKAVEELEKSKVSKNDKESRLMLYEARGFAYFKLQRYDDAVNAYTQALNYDAENIDVILFLSYSYSQLNQYNEALSVLRDALKFHPQNVHVYISIAQCYQEKNMYEDAMSYLKQAISLEPDNVSAHGILADTYMSLGDEDSALREANLVITLDPESYYAEEAQELIDRIQHGTAEENDIDDVDEEIATEVTETFAAPTGATDSKAEKIFAAATFDKKMAPQAMKSAPVTQTDAYTDDERKIFSCTKAGCGKEIPSDSVFCGYCGEKVVLS